MLNLKRILTKIGEKLTSLDGRPYIIEQGAVSYCSYRKWSDGTLEQWGTASVASISGNAAQTVNLAVPFVDTGYTVTLSRGNNATTSVTVFAECNHVNGNRERTVSTFKVSAFKTGYAYTIGFGFYVVGKWK